MADKKDETGYGDMSQNNADKLEGAEGGADSEETKKPSLLESTTSNQSTSEWLHQYFAEALGITGKPKPESVLDEVTFEGIARYIKSDKCKKIVTMAGAGISTSAGIPDFRSPGTGLYDNLEKYNLPSPQSVFDISYFEENPEPFFILCKDLLPGQYEPTPCHYFIKLLEEKGQLLRHFTQNIDTLERAAGLSDETVVEAHGTFHRGHCQKCGLEYTQEWMQDKIMNHAEGESPVPRCKEKDCDGVVKPDIVFFGEQLPAKFAHSIGDLEECDLLIIMGTSLVVHPFASLTSRVKSNTPRLYINLEQTGGGGGHPLTVLMFGGGFAFDQEDNIRDVFWQGTCDDGCRALAELLGWKKDLEDLINKGHENFVKTQKSKGAGSKTTSATSQKASTSKGASPSLKKSSSPAVAKGKTEESCSKDKRDSTESKTPTKSVNDSKDKSKKSGL